MANLNLYLVNKEYLMLEEMLYETGGELTPEIEAALAINKETLTTKAVDLAIVIKDTEADIVSLDNEIKRLTELKKARTGAVDRVKTTIKDAMVLHGVQDIKGQNFMLKIGESKAIEIFDESLIPEIYKEREEVVKIPKKAISDSIKAGHAVPGARQVTNKNLQIK